MSTPFENAADTVAMVQDLLTRLAPKDAMDGRRLYVRTTVRPAAFPVTALTGGRLYTVHPLGLLVRDLSGVSFVPYDTITEIFATDYTPEDVVY